MRARDNGELERHAGAHAFRDSGEELEASVVVGLWVEGSADGARNGPGRRLGWNRDGMGGGGGAGRGGGGGGGCCCY